MDNIENIILFIIIAFSIFSSIMKKKKKVEASKNLQKSERKPGLMDLFQEFNKSMSNRESEPGTESEVDAYFLETQKEEKRLAEIDKTERIQAKMGKKSFSEYQKPTYYNFKETNYDMAYDNAENELNLSNNKLHDFRKLLRNPNSLRDYVLMMEILGKPKALQEF